MNEKVETKADIEVRARIDAHRSFALVAGAGSGKTTSLIDALAHVRAREGKQLRQNGQRIACVTYTKRAVEVIKTKLGFDELYLVSTVHSFLWEQMSRFHDDIRDALRLGRIPALIHKERKKDAGGSSRTAIDARAKVERLEKELAGLGSIPEFKYSDLKWGDYSTGRLGHDDIIEIAAYLFERNATFRRIVGLRFPYIFVDEAQDTSPGIVAGLNRVCEGEGLPIVGYFGDPWQQIYDGSIGNFIPPNDEEPITKIENFRSSKSVIRFLNAFRGDVEQYPAGKNEECEGSVIIRLVQAEIPELDKNRYSDLQIQRASLQLDAALADWKWDKRGDVIKLFLVNQMIARRMGFFELNRLFSGDYASTRSKEAFEKGEYFLLTPLTRTIYPLVVAEKAKDSRAIIDILRRDSPAFAADGINAAKSLKSMIDISRGLVERVSELWSSGTIGDVLRFCAQNQIIMASDSLLDQIGRAPRNEDYDEALHVLDKGDWLADALFAMKTDQIEPYASYVAKNTAYSTQHGVKGEEYSKVLVVYDDVEAAWNDYNFGKTLTPTTSGKPTAGQLDRGRRLAYVSFSRAIEDLRVLFFTRNPVSGKQELIDRKIATAEQIEIVSLPTGS